METHAQIGRRISVASLWLFMPLLATGCSTTKPTQSGITNTQPSWSDKITAPFKAGASSVASKMETRQSTANDQDELSLSNKVNKKNPQLLVAVAQMSERAGNFEDAEKQYQKALKVAPKDLDAQVGFAHLKDRQSKLDEACELYHKAIKDHPQEAAIYNDLGLCYHRRSMLPEAQTALSKAVELAGDRKLYRNNLAAVLVEQNNYDAALVQLHAAHGPAAGHYNLGYMLAKKGNKEVALVHFQQAATLDPTLTAAQQWIVKLNPASNLQLAQLPSQAAAAPQAQQSQPLNANVGPRYAPDLGTAPQPARTPAYLQTNAPATAPATVKYPSQQTAGYTGTAALPPSPTPTQYR